MKFSVIIPAYNAEKFIAQAIQSCLTQTYPAHEIIVVDDGSTDATVAVAASYTPAVRVLCLPQNSGVSIARNRGVEASTGDWIAFLDADDWFLPEKLEHQYRLARDRAEAALIYTGFRMIAPDGSTCEARFFPPGKLWPMLRYRNCLHLSSVVLRRSEFEAVGGFNPALRTAQDWDLWLRLVARYSYSVQSFDAVPQPLSVYRKVPGSLSSDAMRYFYQRIPLIESSCLLGTTGFSRMLWRRRIKSFNYFDTALALREEGSATDLRFALKSIALFPFPSRVTPLRRYKVAACMAKQHFRRKQS